MTNQPETASLRVTGEHVLRRIAWLTLAFGAASAVAAVLLQRLDWAQGLAGGAVLGWLNFRWLSRGIRAIVTSALPLSQVHKAGDGAPTSAHKSTISTAGTYFGLLFRYALVGLGVYVIFNYLHVPLVSIGLGLCALVAAIITASVWEVLQPET